MNRTQHSADMMNVNCPFLEIREVRSLSDLDIPLVSSVCDPRISLTFHLGLWDKGFKFEF